MTWKKIFIIVIIILFFVADFIPTIGGTNLENMSNQEITNKNILYVGGNGEGNYTTIQDAIDNANEDDTIYVFNGIYKENILISKNRLTLVGEDKESTIIKGDGNKHTITIELANNVTITSFSITTEPLVSEFAGIYIYNCIDTLIQNNLIFENGQGIKCKDAQSFNISNNEIFKNIKFEWNAAGIWIESGNHWVVRKNRIYENVGGILVIGVFGNYIPSPVIECNKITDNTDSGLIFDSCKCITIQKNEITNHYQGIFIINSHNSNLTFAFNNIIDNNLSIWILLSSGFQFINNNIDSYNETLIQIMTFSFSLHCNMNYWGTNKWPRLRCQPFFAPLIFFPWRIKPVDIPKCWPD